MKNTVYVDDLKKVEDLIFSRLGNSIRMAAPLGLGKPNQLINRLYDHVKANKNLSLKIFTALSLDYTDPSNDLERKFLQPFYERHFGHNYPKLNYVQDLKKNRVPENISIHEFYFQAGVYLRSKPAQMNYVSVNYTHVDRVIMQYDINLVVQYVAKSPDGKKLSLGCNPDLTLDVVDLYNKHNKPLYTVAVVHPDLPYLGGDAEVAVNFFDVLVETPEVNHTLFALPKGSVDVIDHMIGFHASLLVLDGGTLQIGIGSLSDALVHSVICRQTQNELYRKVATDWRYPHDIHHHASMGTNIFEQGLYGTSEMLMDGFMHLRKEGILKREIFDQDEKKRIFLHGAFFLGSKNFYSWLFNLSSSDYAGISMTRVSKVNDLYDPHELALRRQRKKARFFNTTMNMTMLGEAASETLENSLVVSGVGGQYNFVAMAHELEDAHSVLMLRSYREKDREKISNIVNGHSHITIPRHLRDVVVTEYGIAFLKGLSDEDVIKKIIEITDSNFQEELIANAKKKGKLSPGYEVPHFARNNTFDKIESFVKKYQPEGLFKKYPFGYDFTEEELILSEALLYLKESTVFEKISCLVTGLFVNKEKEYSKLIARLDLDKIKSIKDFILKKIVIGALSKTYKITAH